MQKVFHFIYVLVFCISGFFASCTRALANNGGDSLVHYRITPMPKADRTELNIQLQYKVYSDTPVSIRLPEDFYGVPDIYKYVVDFKGNKDCTVSPVLNPAVRIVTPNADKEISISYTISYDPVKMEGFSFGPNVGPAHFHLAGCQWMLVIGNSTRKYTCKITIENGPAQWKYYSSLADNATNTVVYDSYDNLLSMALGGGAQPVKRFLIKGKPLFVFVAGTYTIPVDEIFDAVNKIISLQRSWFSDFDFPFYNVSIMPKQGVIAGTCVPNMFLCFVKPEITREELNILIAHEVFHTWLPNKMYLTSTQGESELKYEWFAEGFADYFARKILLDAGLIGRDRFIELINRDIINIADNPHKNDTYAGLLDASAKGQYNTAYKKLSYYRGALIALNWERNIQKKNKNWQLRHMMLDMYQQAKVANGVITESAFYVIGKLYGIDIKADVDAFIIQGRPVLLYPDAFGKSYHLAEKKLPSFDPGFSLSQTFRTRKIKDVVPGSNAFKAGLRNEMDFVRIKNSNRFGNGWLSDQPIVVTVMVAGKEQTIEFYPYGQPMLLQLYTKAG